MWAYTSGMTPQTFWDATVREVLLMIKAFDKRELAELRRLRLLRYDTYCVNSKPEERVSMFEYMPLDGDPTEEEIAEMEREVIEVQQNEDKNFYEAASEYYRQHGIAI